MRLSRLFRSRAVRRLAARSGFYLVAPALPAGDHDIAVFAQSAVPGRFAVMRVVRVTVTP